MSRLLSICDCGCGDGLPACFLTVPLSRSRSFAISGRFALRGRVAWLSRRRFCSVIASSCAPPRSTCLKRFNRCSSLSNHPSVACGDVMPFNNPLWLILSLLARSARLVGWRPAPVSPFSPLCPPDGEGVVVCAVSLMKRRKYR